MRRRSLRALELAALVSDDRAGANALATVALRRAAASAEPREDALVLAVAQLAGPERLGRLLLGLVDVENLPESHAARQVGLTAEELRRQLARARAEAGLRAVPPRCRGWELVRRRATATPAEARAAEGHLAVCRRCRGRVAEAARAREVVVTRGLAASAVVAADAVAVAGGMTGGGGAVLGALLGKAGVAIIGATAITVAAAAGSVAARSGGSPGSPVHPGQHHVVRPGVTAGPGGPAGPVAPASSGPATGPDQGRAASPAAPQPTVTTLPPAPVPPLPTSLSTGTTAVLPLPLPTVDPGSPLPTLLPTLPPALLPSGLGTLP